MPGPIKRQWVPPVCTTSCLQMLPILLFTMPIQVGPHIKLSNLSLPHSTCKNSRYIPRINVFDLSSSWELITDAAPHWTSLGTPLAGLANRFRPFPYRQTPSLQAGLSQSCCCDYGSWEPSLDVDMSHCLGIIWESGHRAVTHQGPSYSTRKWAPGLERSGSWSENSLVGMCIDGWASFAVTETQEVCKKQNKIPHRCPISFLCW